ncbi:MAG: carboxypeptidase regulatory-like domain-containing protein [Planctomycetes bacterium]|nr:carboxypeptidase regulatory-like domain-containing protein [Planctomycetota bacterium]
MRRPPPPPEFFKPPDLPPSDVRAVQLRGRVLDASGKPIANVPVLVIGGGHSGERPVTNAAGEFRVSGLPPTLEGYVAVHVPGYAVAVREPVRIVERNPDSVTLRLEPEATIDGVVVDPDGNPLANARVEARGERRLKTPIRKGATWEEVLQLDVVRTDEHGRFHLGGLYTGEFELTARWPRAVDVFATTTTVSGARDVRVRVDPKERDQVLFVGRVVDAVTHSPIAGVDVWARPAPTDEELSREASSRPRVVTTGSSGEFVLGPFPAARFELGATYRAPAAREAATWAQSGAREPGLHRLDIQLDRDER